MNLVRNIPSPEGAEVGAALARLTEYELKELLKTFPNHQERCGTCAFRKGTIPNRSLATVADALKCVLEKKEFFCHENTEHLCVGWMIASRSTCDKEPSICPWEFSGGEDDPGEEDDCAHRWMPTGEAGDGTTFWRCTICNKKHER